MRPSSPPHAPPLLLPARLHHLVHLSHLLASTASLLQLNPLVEPPQLLQLDLLLQLTPLMQLDLLLNLASRAAVSAEHNSARQRGS